MVWWCIAGFDDQKIFFRRQACPYYKSGVDDDESERNEQRSEKK